MGFLVGDMGIANFERYLNTLRAVVEFASQSAYVNVLAMISPLNEVRALARSPLTAQPLMNPGGMGIQAGAALHTETYRLIRSITGQGAGPLISLSTGVLQLSSWTQTPFLSGADRVSFDQHTYGVVFATPVAQTAAEQIATACGSGTAVRQAMGSIVAITGELSLASTDCGKYLNGALGSTRPECACRLSQLR